MAPFAIAASAADAAVYEVVDRFDPFKTDPDGNLIPGEPLDKGFAVTGTMDATGLGFFDDSAFDNTAPFKSWNITETVRKADLPDATYRFTEANSSWTLNQASFIPGLPVLEITENFIFLLQTNIGGFTAQNSLTLQNPGADKQFL